MALELLELMDKSSFLNLWFWVFLAVAWSRATYWTLGVALHDARLAFQRGGRYMTEFETMININCSRFIEVFDNFGTALLALAGFGLATFGTLGFAFGMELMQAIFLLLLPLALTTLFSLGFAYKIRRLNLSGERLYRAYCSHRHWKQFFGALTLVIVAIWAVLRAILTPTF